jgi:TIGR03009 family protein
MLTSSVVLGVWSLVVWSGQPAAFAQQPAGNAEVRQPRPQNAALQVQNLPQELERLLLAWSQNSAKIQKLQGRHLRHVYDTVFNVEKRSMGVFYYEGPGKGRIDLTPAPIQNGQVSERKDAQGQTFKLQADRPERWMCDGKDIWQVNDTLKQVDIFPIPQENQGQNIMDGPMPFLFGMPPAKAKMRYHLKLISEDKDRAMIEVLPRLQVDAANWKKALVILDKTLYLPTAVKLIDPSGNLETVYQFGEFQVNKKDPNWLQVAFGADPDPFRPELKGYARLVHKPGLEMPSVAGLGYNDAKALLEKLGFPVKHQYGKTASEDKLTYVVYEPRYTPT